MSGPTESASTNQFLTVSICKGFSSRDHSFRLDIEFVVAAGFTVLFGPSGSGKTTLLDCVAGLSVPDAGRISIGSRMLFNSEKRLNVPVAKRGLAYVLQDIALFPHLTIEQNVEYGLSRFSSDERKHRTEAILREFRIDHLRRQRPDRISGGERQRVALARSLVTDPCLLLLDEPLSALDVTTKSKIIEDLRRWNQAHKIPILYVTHSREEVIALGERVLVIEDGRVIADGTPHEVLRAPRQESLAQLAGFENIFDATVESLHPDRGTMTCRLWTAKGKDELPLEAPLIRAEVGTRLRVGIRASDILLAIARPAGLSARNVIPGVLVSLQTHDMIVSARVDCGSEFEVHLTLAARDDLKLEPGATVWLIVKTHSCHLMQK